MTNLSAWIRDNLVIVVSVAVMVICVLALVYLAMFKVGHTQELASPSLSLQSEVGRQRSGITLNVPTDDPRQPQSVRVIPSQAVVEAYRGIFEQLKASYQEQLDAALAFNRPPGTWFEQQLEGKLSPRLLAEMGPYRHEPMYPGLFGQGTAASASTRINARDHYRDNVFEQLYQRLGAGTPPSQEQLQEVAARVEDAYANQLPLTPPVQREMEARKAQAQIRALTQRAGQINIYAPPRVQRSQPAGQQQQPALFQTGAWVTSADPPDMATFWEAQMQLWMQQDLVEAIARANTAGPDAREPGRRLNVLEAPVKRVLSMDVKEGYVRAPEATSAGGRTSAGRTAATVDPAQRYARQVRAFETNLTRALPMDFSIPRPNGPSPTGRVTNALYLVRHAEMSLIVDSTKLPLILEKIASVNFNTVINMSLRPVDLVEHFELGYVYGDKVDVVQLDLTIESLWMTQWTVGRLIADPAQGQARFEPGLMPPSVRDELDFPATPTYQPDGGGRTTPRWDDGGGMGGPGMPPRDYE